MARVCRVCKSKYDKPINPLIPVCSIQCGFDLSQITLAKKREKEFIELKRRVKGESLKTRKRAAKEACHLYIRTRDKNKPCICCGNPLIEGFQAGHFLPSGQNSTLRYNEDNIHGQNLHCNYYSGDTREYEANLIERIGKDRVEALKAQKGGTVKRTADDYREIETYYKNKLKELLNNS